MGSLPLPLLLLIFVGAAVVVWWAGKRLSDATEVLDRRFGWGDALGGLAMLAVVTNLPDVAVVGSAALGGNLGLATGSLLGGIAFQMVVLAVLDLIGGGSGVPLTSRTRTLIPALEALMVIMGLTVVLLGSQLKPMETLRIEPAALAIFLIWIAGLLVVRRASYGLAWKLDEENDQPSSTSSNEARDASTRKAIGLFAMAAIATFSGGVMLEQSGDLIATELGVESVVFGATALAAATSIPDLSTGIEAVRLGDHQLAVSGVFGAGAFLPTLFLLAGLLAGRSVLSASGALNMYLAAFGAVLACIYLMGLVFRSRNTVFKMGLDSLMVIITYVIGILGLVFLV